MTDKVMTTDIAPIEAIERDIERTKAGLRRTIDDIEERFSAVHLTALAIERGKKLLGLTSVPGQETDGAVRDHRTGAGRFLQVLKNDPVATLVFGFTMGAWIAVAIKSLLSKPGKKSGLPVEQKTLGTVIHMPVPTTGPQQRAGKAA